MLLLFLARRDGRREKPAGRVPLARANCTLGQVASSAPTPWPGGRGGPTHVVDDICGNLVAWWRKAAVAAEPSSDIEARSLVADEALIFAVEDDVERVEELADGVARIEEAGDSFLSRGGLGKRRRSQPWRNAWEGVIRAAGSQSKHRSIKSRKRGSAQPLRAVCRLLDPGVPRGLPRREWPP